MDELVRIDPKEVIFPNSIHEELSKILETLAIARLVPRDGKSFELEPSQTTLTMTFDVADIHELQLSGLTVGYQASGGLLQYLTETQPTLAHAHLRRPWIRLLEQEMQLDPVHPPKFGNPQTSLRTTPKSNLVHHVGSDPNAHGNSIIATVGRSSSHPTLGDSSPARRRQRIGQSSG